MKTLDLDLINDDTKEIAGKASLFEIGQLSPQNPVKG